MERQDRQKARQDKGKGRPDKRKGSEREEKEREGKTKGRVREGEGGKRKGRDLGCVIRKNQLSCKSAFLVKSANRTNKNTGVKQIKLGNFTQIKFL